MNDDGVMGMIKTLLVVGALVTVVQSPSILGNVADGVSDIFAPDAEATTSQDQKSYDRICPLVEVWSDMDADGRQATTKTIRVMARKQANTTDDPALKAFLKVVPEALGSGSGVQSAAARALIDRECQAHRN